MLPAQVVSLRPPPHAAFFRARSPHHKLLLILMPDLSNDASTAPGHPGVRSVSIQALGTRCRLQFRCADQAAAMKFMAAAAAWLGAFERQCSRLTPGSLVSRINEAAGKDWVAIDQEMELLLKAADTASGLTEGLFNPAALPLTNLWAQARAQDRAPSDAEIAEALELSNWQAVRREPGRILLPRAGMGLDLETLSRKYAVDTLVRLLRQHGIQDALVQAGGDVFALGSDGEGPGWKIGLEHGVRTPGDAALMLSNEAVSCAGRDDVTVDTRSGHPPLHELRGVTVVASNCLTAGVHAASMLILGQDEGLRLAESTGMVDARLLNETGAAVTTRGFSRRLSRPEAPARARPAEPKVAKKWLARDLIRLWPWLLPAVLLLITLGPAGFLNGGSQPGAAAAALGMVWMTFLITRRLWGHYRAHAAATMLMFTLGLFAVGWLPMPDMTLCFLNLAAIAALVHQRAWTFVVLLGLGCFVKGPAAVLVPASAALGLWLAGGRKTAAPWLAGSGIALALSMVSIFGKGTPDAGSAGTGLPAAFGESRWYFLPLLFLALMPWSLCTPRVVRQGWRRLRTGTLRARHGLLAGWLLPALWLTPGSLSVRALLLVPALIIAFCPPLADARRLWKIGSTTLALWLAAGFVSATLHISSHPPASPQLVKQEEPAREVSLAVHRGPIKALNLLLPVSHTPSGPTKR